MVNRAKGKNRSIKYLLLLISITFLPVVMGYAYDDKPMNSKTGVAYDSENYDLLAEYGEWDEIPIYGEVWRPYVVADWRPFKHGHWEWTNSGWAWASYEPFGWIVCHYGNWNFDKQIGWYWIPGNKWSPARVKWITYNDYIGWAPIPPRQIDWPAPWSTVAKINPWNVVETKNFTKENVGDFRVMNTNLGIGRDLPETNYKEPDIKIIRKQLNQPIMAIKIQREKVMIGSRHFDKIIFPPAVVLKAQRNLPQIEQRVIVKKNPKPVLQRQIEKKDTPAGQEKNKKDKK